MSDFEAAIRDVITNELDNGGMVGAFVIGAEVIDADGDMTLHEFHSESLPFWSAHGMALSLAATWAPQPGWTVGDDDDD